MTGSMACLSDLKIIAAFLHRKGRKLAPGNASQSFPVFVTGFSHDLRGQSRRGWTLVPTQLLQVIAYVLLVKAGLRPDRPIAVHRPKPGRIRREGLVNKYQLVLAHAKLKF